MHEVKQRPACHRAEDLVTYLYGEATEADALDFSNHLQQCDACRREFDVFNQVHNSIVLWRNEALGATFDPRAVAAGSAIESNQSARHERKLSALAAIREFFAVSPLWLRGATAFAALLLCVLGIAMVARFSQKPAAVANNSSQEQKFTREEMEAAVNRAVEKARAEIAKQNPPATIDQDKPESAQNQPQRAANRQARNARPRGLNRQEREKLAADLRLTTAADEEDILLALPEQEQDRPN